MVARDRLELLAGGLQLVGVTDASPLPDDRAHGGERRCRPHGRYGLDGRPATRHGHRSATIKLMLGR